MEEEEIKKCGERGRRGRGRPWRGEQAGRSAFNSEAYLTSLQGSRRAPLFSFAAYNSLTTHERKREREREKRNSIIIEPSRPYKTPRNRDHERCKDYLGLRAYRCHVPPRTDGRPLPEKFPCAFSRAPSAAVPEAGAAYKWPRVMCRPCLFIALSTVIDLATWAKNKSLRLIGTRAICIFASFSGRTGSKSCFQNGS